ncbi:hypothetical protein GJAV_G00073510, partial [Gymnothorax javanicus]
MASSERTSSCSVHLSKDWLLEWRKAWAVNLTSCRLTRDIPSYRTLWACLALGTENSLVYVHLFSFVISVNKIFLFI